HDVAIGDDPDRAAAFLIVDDDHRADVPVAHPAGDLGERSGGEAGDDLARAGISDVHAILRCDCPRLSMWASRGGLIAINDRAAGAPRRPRARGWARAMAGALAFAGALCIGHAAPAAAPVDGHVVRVLDGDSLLVRLP